MRAQKSQWVGNNLLLNENYPYCFAGANPYPKMKKEQVISTLHLGKRMLKPPYCSDEL